MSKKTTELEPEKADTTLRSPSLSAGAHGCFITAEEQSKKKNQVE